MMSRAACCMAILVAIPLLGASPSDPYPEGVKVTPKVAIADDISLRANSMGWTVDEAASDYRVAEIVGSIAERIAVERPDAFVGSALSQLPGGPPTLLLKGPADSLVRALVESSEIEIMVADNQPFSFDELEGRKLRVHQALENLGFQNVATRVNITGGGVIPAWIATEPGLPADPETVVAALPADLRSSVDLTITDLLPVEDTTSFGGMLVTKSGVGDATSGWSVVNLTSGVTGVTTAGHATGEDGIVHPGHGTHSFVLQAEHRGTWGDIEWHTTNYAEVDDFYSDAATIRDVLDVEPRANISVGEAVCQYGRFSNDRDCSPTVIDVSLACTLNGVFNNRLVQMSVITSQPGDSGGGWSFGPTAYGSQKGWCFGKDTWSVADLYDEALNVSVILNLNSVPWWSLILQRAAVQRRSV